MNARLPQDQLFLQRQLPREAWGNFPPQSLAATWLAMHASLLAAADGHFRHLHGHHRLEDTHCFPRFRRMQPRLQQGFDLLAADHRDVDVATTAIEASLRELRAASEESAASRQLADTIALQLHALGTLLRQHLDDEESLVIPLLALVDVPETVARRCCANCIPTNHWTMPSGNDCWRSP